MDGHQGHQDDVIFGFFTQEWGQNPPCLSSKILGKKRHLKYVFPTQIAETFVWNWFKPELHLESWNIFFPTQITKTFVWNWSKPTSIDGFQQKWQDFGRLDEEECVLVLWRVEIANLKSVVFWKDISSQKLFPLNKLPGSLRVRAPESRRSCKRKVLSFTHWFSGTMWVSPVVITGFPTLSRDYPPKKKWTRPQKRDMSSSKNQFWFRRHVSFQEGMLNFRYPERLKHIDGELGRLQPDFNHLLGSINRKNTLTPIV